MLRGERALNPAFAVVCPVPPPPIPSVPNTGAADPWPNKGSPLAPAAVDFSVAEDPPPYNTPYWVVLVLIKFGTLRVAVPVEPVCAKVRVELPFVPLPTAS